MLLQIIGRRSGSLNIPSIDFFTSNPYRIITSDMPRFLLRHNLSLFLTSPHFLPFLLLVNGFLFSALPSTVCVRDCKRSSASTIDSQRILWPMPRVHWNSTFSNNKRLTSSAAAQQKQWNKVQMGKINRREVGRFHAMQKIFSQFRLSLSLPRRKKNKRVESITLQVFIRSYPFQRMHN